MKKNKSDPQPVPLRVLILEDNPADAELIERQLRRAKIDFTSQLVEGKRNFSHALVDFKPQVILSDFKLPAFDGLAALEVARARVPDTPFIFVSGSIGEEKAIETLSLGAADYIFKDNLARLGPAVKRVVNETRLKLEKKKTDEELRHHVDALRFLAEAADRFVQINDLDKLYGYLAQAARSLSGADYLAFSMYDDKLLALRPKIILGLEPFWKAVRRHFASDPLQMVFFLKDMRREEFSAFVSRRLTPGRGGLHGLLNRKIPRAAAGAIEKLLAVGGICSMGLSWENQLFGGLTFLFRQGHELKNPSQIEALGNLAAVSIKRLLAEQSLRESEQKYRTLVTQSPDGIFIADLQGNFLSVNQSMCAGLGYEEEEFLSLKILDILPAQYADLHQQRLAAILQGETINEAAEYVVTGKGGETHYVAIHSAPFFKDNQLIGFQGIARDITEKKKMEIRLRESEEYYRTLMETSPDAIIIVDAGGRVTFASQRTFAMFGVPAQFSIIGMSILDFVEPGEKRRVQERMAEILSGLSQPGLTVYRLLRHDRQPFWGEVSSSPLRDAAGRSIALLLVCRDVTERRQAEEKIQYQASLLQDVSDAIIATDESGAVRVWNRAAETIYGWKAEEALGMPLRQLLSPIYGFQERDEVFEKLHREGAWSGEIIHHHHDGRPITIQSSITNLRGPGGEAAGMVSINSDISERKRVEAEFLREKIFFEKLVATAPMGIVIADNQGRVLKVNSEFVRMFGYDFDEAPGKLIDDLVVPPENQEEARALNQSVSEGKKAVLESVRRTKDGTLMHVSIIIAPIHIEGKQVAVFAIYQDISERKRAEAIQHIQYKIANAVVSAETFFGLFETVRNELSALLDTTNFLIALYDEASGMLSAPFEKDEKDTVPQWRAEKSLTGLVIRQKRSLLLNKEQIQRLAQDGTIELIGSRAEAWLGLPLQINDKVLGAIVVQSYKNADAYDQGSIRIMEMIANQLSIYIEHELAEAEILQEKAFLEALVETAPEGIAIHDKLGRVLRVNSEFVRMFGYDAGEVVGKVIDDLVVPLESREEAGALTGSVGAGEKVVLETVRKRKDGTLFNVSIIGAPIQIGDRQVAVYAIYRDITERRRDEELLRASLKEKEVLLQEIHHRVKNNLQIVSGLLTLQADQAGDKSLDEIFRDSQDRIRSIALVHEKLYRSHNLAEIAFDDYLRALVDNLITSHEQAAGRVSATYDMESILFAIDKAIPLGLIVNELVTNSLKHAFPAGRRGEIRISLRRHPGAKSFALKTDSGTLHVAPTCELVVADDGVGLPSGQTPLGQKTLGMNLVSMLARQLQAELRFKTGPGSEFRLVFSGLPANGEAKDKLK